MIEELPTPQQARKRIYNYYDKDHHEQLQKIGMRIYLRSSLILSLIVTVIFCIGLLLFTKYSVLVVILVSAIFGSIWTVVQTSIVPVDFSYTKNRVLLKMVEYISQNRLPLRKIAQIKQIASENISAGGIQTAMAIVIIPILAAYWLGVGKLPPMISFIVGGTALAIIFLFICKLCEINSNSMIAQAVNRYDHQQADLKVLLGKDVPERKPALTSDASVDPRVP
jgi:hypothetical protein